MEIDDSRILDMLVQTNESTIRIEEGQKSIIRSVKGQKRRLDKLDTSVSDLVIIVRDHDTKINKNRKDIDEVCNSPALTNSIKYIHEKAREMREFNQEDELDTIKHKINKYKLLIAGVTAVALLLITSAVSIMVYFR